MHIHFAEQPGLSACQGSSGQSPALQRDAQSAARRCSAAPDPAAGVPLCRWKHGVRSALNAFSMFNKTGAVRDGEVVWRLDEASLQQEQEAQYFVSPRVHTPHTHGTGCTLSSAVAAYYPHKNDLRLAVSSAKSYLQGAIEAGAAWKVGSGHGPLAHFWRISTH